MPTSVGTNADRLITPSFTPLSDLVRTFNIERNKDIANSLYYAKDVIAMPTTIYTVKHPANCVVPGTTFNRHSPDADTVKALEKVY